MNFYLHDSKKERQHLFKVYLLIVTKHTCLYNTNTDGPRYMRSFYLQICIYAIEKWPFFWNLSSNLQ